MRFKKKKKKDFFEKLEPQEREVLEDLKLPLGKHPQPDIVELDSEK